MYFTENVEINPNLSPIASNNPSWFGDEEGIIFTKFQY